MAGVDDKVVVPPDSDAVGAKAIDNTLVTTSAGDVRRQCTSTSDPVDPLARGRVLDHLPTTADFGQVVRHVPPGYDSGCQALTIASAEVTSATIKARGILLCNLTATVQAVTLEDGGGVARLKAYPLQAHMSEWIPLGGITIAAPHWNAGANASVNAQLIGE